MVVCWWCRSPKKTTKCRLKFSRTWVHLCKDCIQKIQKENSPQKNPPREKKETDITEISKFEWKEKTCEDIIEDMRKMLF